MEVFIVIHPDDPPQFPMTFKTKEAAEAWRQEQNRPGTVVIKREVARLTATGPSPLDGAPCALLVPPSLSGEKV